jgi:NADPH-dependent ferric siderophore reductase
MATVRLRREPPAFRQVEVVRTAPVSPRLLRVTLGGPDLAGLDAGLPAASVRLLLPRAAAADLVLPAWNGNEFLHDDGT